MKDSAVYLRRWRSSDALHLYHIFLGPGLKESGICRYDGIDDCLNAIKVWAQNPNAKAIVEKSSDTVVGMIMLGDMNRYQGYYEMEYAISVEKRGRGYAKEAIRQMLAHAFSESDAEVIAAWVRAHNPISAHVLEECGFSFEGRLRKHARDKSDTLCYSLIKSDWAAENTD